MDPKVYDLQNRLTRLTREEDNLNAEVRELLPDLTTPGRQASDLMASGRQALTGEKLAKYKWIESRLDEIQAWKRQLTEKLDKVKREQAAGS
ncbi:MAG: hypothetical protein ISS55_07845 [Dehalococcoidales bacterium]|nr:hypothetical protein [Dehalococcoidales bacterium]